jgi:hypothetical protein
VGQQCQAAGAVNGTGNVTGSMRWNLTATVPAGVVVGTIPVAVFTTTISPPNEGFACAPVVGGVGTVACNGTTVGNALLGSTVTVVFAPGITATGTITGPGGSVNNIPLLPPPPPPPLLLPPPLLPPPPGPVMQQMPAMPPVPVIPEADSFLLVAVGIIGIGTLAGLRAYRRRKT